MAYAPTGEVEELIREQMASGKYESEDALLTRALRLLSEYEESIGEVRSGLEEEKAGRLRPLREVDAELRREHGIPRQS